MILAYNDWEHGHSPVTNGRAPWLPLTYSDAVHEVSAAVRRAQGARRERSAARARLAEHARSFR